MGCFRQKGLLKTGAEKSRQVLWVFNKGRFVSVELECCVNHMFQFSQPTFLFWCHHAEPGNKSGRDSMRLIHSHRAFHSLDGRQPWAPSCPVKRPDGGGWGEARRGRGWGLTAAALWHFCTASRWVEANSNLSHEPCALRQGHYQPGRLVVSSGPLNEAFVISLRATREGECSSAAFCWQELSEACSFLTDSCPVTASYKTVWYDSLSIDASEGYQWLRGKCHQVRVDHKWLKGQLFNNADSFDLICPGFEISVSYCFSLFLMKFWWKLFTLTFVD